MRRYFIALIVVAATVVSCMPKYEPDPLDGGKRVYNLANFQQEYAMDFFNTAMKLNILLTDAKAQDKLDKLTDIKVTIDGQEYGLQYVLFGAGVSITSTSNHTIYNISYDRNATIQSRRGILTVNTGGKLLDEITAGDAWNIAPSDTDILPFTYVSEQTSPLYVESANMYIMAGASPHTWDVSMEGFSLYYTNDMKSDWDISVNIAQFDRTTLGYADYRTSRFEWRGGGEGLAINGWKVKYAIDPTMPIKALPSCGFAFPSAGKVTVTVDDSVIISEPELIPARTVVVEWQYIGNCQYDRTMYYNGVSGKV